jgi:hypothetical protein
MTAAAPRHAPFLCPPGTKMLLEVGGLPGKLATVSVGHAKGRFVVTHLPVMPEAGRESLHQMLYPDNGVIARFLLEGTVMGFSATIIRTVQLPFPLLFLTYPSRLESLDLRRHRRVPCCIPALIDLAETQAQGMIVDLSLTGCQFSAILQTNAAPRVSIDDRMELRCELFGQGSAARLPGMVKRVGISEKRLEIGLKFLDIAQSTRDAIADYLQNALLVLD